MSNIAHLISVGTVTFFISIENKSMSFDSVIYQTKLLFLNGPFSYRPIVTCMYVREVRDLLSLACT